MPALYEYLADSTRAKYPLESLDPKVAKFLSTEVPAGYSQTKLMRVLDMAERGIGKYARAGGASSPHADATPDAAPQMLPSHRPGREYDLWGRPKQLYAQVMQSVGYELSQAPLENVPPPEGMAEHVASIVGSLPAFAAKTAVLQSVGVPSPVAVGGAMAASRGTPKERLIRGITGAGTAGVAGVAGKALEPVVGPLGHLATTAVGFGAAQPAAESLTHRLTGEPDYPAPTLADLVRGTAEMAVIAGAPMALGAMRGGRARPETSRAEVLGPDRQLPPHRIPRNRQLLPGNEPEVGPVIELGGDPNAPAPVLPVSRRLPPGPTPPGPEPILMPAGKTNAQVRNPVLEKLAPEFAGDRRAVAAGRTVADVFADMVQAEAGEATDRAAWKAAVRRVVASGRIQAVQDVAAAMAEPGGKGRDAAAVDGTREREARFSEELNQRAAGRVVTLNLGGQPTQLRIARAVSFRYAGEERPIRVIAEDPSNGKLYPLRFRSVAEFAQAVNNPQALVKVEDVFARAERQREIRARGKAPAGAGGPEAAPVAAPDAAAPAAPPRPVPKPVPAPGRVEVPRGPVKPIPLEKRAEYVAKMAEGYADLHKKIGPEMGKALEARLEQQARDKGADPADRLGAIEALRRIRGNAGGPGREGPGTGPSEPPPAPAKPKGPKPKPAPAAAAAEGAQSERPRAVLDLPFSDAKRAQAVADRMNRENPDFEATVVTKRGKVLVEVNSDAKDVVREEKPKAPPVPKAEPAAAPAAPESKPAEEPAAGKAAVEDRPAGGSGDTPAAPAANPEKPAEVDPAADLEAMRQQSRFKEGQRISVPNGEGATHNDARERVKGFVKSWVRDKDGAVMVRVAVAKGRGWREFNVREEHARALPNKKPGIAKRASEHERRVGEFVEKHRGNPAAARREVEARDAMLQQARDKADDLRAGPGQPPARENESKYRKARADAVKAERLRAAAEEARRKIVEEAGGAVHPDILPFFEREKDPDSFITPLINAAEDFPKHFTLERQAAYLHRAATLEIPNAREWKSAVDFERGMAERGVDPAHAARAADETIRIRRFIEQNVDNPLFDAGEAKAFREQYEALLAPERVDTPEALEKMLKEFEREVPFGPADDIPAGVQPEPPDGFVNDLNERGFVNAELLAPWLWLKHLREIPKRLAQAVRNIPRKARRFTVYDGSGNAVHSAEHALYEPDYYTQSAMTRLLAHIGLEPGAHVLTPELRISYKAAMSQNARIKALWRFDLYKALGEDLSQKVRAFSKHSVQLDRVLEGRANISSLPADIQPAVKIFKEWYRQRWEFVKAEMKKAGDPEPQSRFEGEYVGPRLVLGHISKTLEPMFADLLNEGRITPEVSEQRNRFLHERTGDLEYREDAMYRAAEYIDAMARYLSHRQFFREVKDFADVNRATDKRRVGAIINLLKGTLLRKKGWFERQMDGALASIRFAKSPLDIDEHSLDYAARELGVTKEQLKNGSGIERVFVVPKGVKFRVGGGKESFDLGVLANGDRLVGTGGAHLFGELPTIRRSEAAKQRLKIKAEVKKLAALEAANVKATGEKGGYLSPFFSHDQHEQMMFDQWHDSVMRSRNDLTAAAFRAVGDRITRSVLAGNLRATLQNSMQPWLTMAPELGYRRTLQAMIENSLAGQRGRRSAEMIGALQGELARSEELTTNRSWFRNVVDALGPMSGYKAAEDFTRGVGMMGGEMLGRRLGYKHPVSLGLSGEINPAFFEGWGQKIEAMKKSGTTENLQATLDTEMMFDYNMLGQSPIFGGALGKVFGRLMTFPGRYFRRYVTRPLGGTAKVARALALGSVDRATGGALSKAGMKVGPEARFSRRWKGSRELRGKYPGPANAFEAFLEHYGARQHDRQAAVVFLRQAQGLGMLAGIAAATGLNAFIVGTPGWERLPLLALLSFTPKGSSLHKYLEDALQTTQRSAVIDPERGVESTFSPLIKTAYTMTKETPDAFAAAQNRAKASDPMGAAAALSKPLRKALQETGLQMIGQPLVAIRRAFQQAPFAEQFFKTEGGKRFAHVMGIKSYIKGNGAWGFIKGTFGLTMPAEEAKRRQRIDEKPKQVRVRKLSRRRGSLYSSVIGQPGEAAYA